MLYFFIAGVKAVIVVAEDTSQFDDIIKLSLRYVSFSLHIIVYLGITCN